MEDQQEDLFIDTEMITNENVNLDDYKCPICHNVYWDPISCDNCMNHFCRQCHKKNMTKKCPLCNSISETRRAVPLLRSLLSMLKLKCVNQNNGCLEITEYDIYDKHIKGCPYQLQICGLKYTCRQKCTKQILRMNINEHRTQECNFRLVACTYCGVDYPFIDLEHHMLSCDEAMIQCQKCQQSIKLKDVNIHSEICLGNFVTCSYCQQQLIKKDILIHENDCTQRQISCLGCSDKMLLQDYYCHQSNCPQFPMICPQCHSKMSRQEFMTHGQLNCIQALKRYIESEMAQSRMQVAMCYREMLNCKQNSPSIRFSQKLRDSDIFINPDKMMATVRDQKRKRKDRFALLSQALTESMSWKFECLSVKSDWFAIGATEITSLYIQKKYQETGHGSYLVSANGIKYSNHNAENNWKQSQFKIEQGDILNINYNHQSRILTVLNSTKHLEETLEINSDDKQYYGCVCLRTAGDQIRILNS